MMNRIFYISIPCVVLFLASVANAQETDFSLLDQDADGKVSIAEFQEYVELRLPGFEFADSFIERVDADGNKEISEEEFEGRMEHLRAIVEEEGGIPEEGDGEEEKEKTEMEIEAETAFLEIGELVSEGNWEQVAERMNDSGRDEFCRTTVMAALALSKLQFNAPVPMPSIEEAQVAVNEVMEEYGLDKLDLEMNINGDKDEDEDEDEGDDKTDGGDSDEEADGPKSQSEIISEALDKDGQRWEIIQALREARSGSPFAADLITGTVDDTETDGEAVLLVVNRKPTSDKQGGMRIEVASPPSVIRMVKTDDKWLYAGMDLERSRAIAQEFMRKRRNPRAPRNPNRSDF